MAGFDGKFESAKQEWTTPAKLYEPLNEKYNFNFDLAADKHNTKCQHYYSENDDSLKQEWRGRCWLNPPYGGMAANKLANWVKKAKSETERGSAELVAVLMPARTNTKWWHDCCMKANKIIFICGRPKFGGAKYGLPQPLAIIIFENVKKELTIDTLRLAGSK